MATQGIDPAFNNAFSALAGGVSKLPEAYLDGQKARVAQEAMANSAAHNDRVATLNEDKWRTQKPGVEATTKLTTAKAKKTEGENVANELYNNAVKRAIVMKMDPVSQNDVPTLTDNPEDLALLLSAASKTGRNPDQAIESIRNLLGLHRGMSDDPDQRIQSQNLRTKSQASDTTITSIEDRDAKAKAKTDAAGSRTAATIAGADARNNASIAAAGERNAAAIAGRAEAAKVKTAAAGTGKFSIADETAVNATGGMAETAIDQMIKNVFKSKAVFNREGKQVVSGDSPETQADVRAGFIGSEGYNRLKDVYSKEFKRVYTETKDATAAKAAADLIISKQSKHETIGRGFKDNTDFVKHNTGGEGDYEYRTPTYNPASTPAAAVSAPATAPTVVAPAAATPAAAVAPAALIPPIAPPAVVPPVAPAVSAPVAPMPAVAPVAPIPVAPGETAPLVPASSATPPIPLPDTSPAAALTPAAAVSAPIVPPTAAVAPTAMPETIPVPGPGPTVSAPATAVVPPAVGGTPAPQLQSPAAAVSQGVTNELTNPLVYNEPAFGLGGSKIQASSPMSLPLPPPIPSGVQSPLNDSVKSGLEFSPTITAAEMVSFGGTLSGVGSSMPKTPYERQLNELTTMRDAIKKNPVKSQERDGFGDPTGVFSSKEDEFRIKQLEQRLEKLKNDPVAKVSPSAALLNNEFMTVPGLIVAGVNDVEEQFRDFVVTANEIRYLLGSYNNAPKGNSTIHQYQNKNGSFTDGITVASQFDKAHPKLVSVFIKEGRLGMKPGDSLGAKLIMLHEAANKEIMESQNKQNIIDFKGGIE